jgi:dihydroorotase
MIIRASERLAIEGYALGPVGNDEPSRLRVEIDTSTGLIRDVGEPRGTADLDLDETYLVLPGFVDLHVHAREDVTAAQSYKEDFQTAGLAAIHGGVTAFADMPNNPCPPVDDASYAAKRELARTCPVDVLPFAAVGPRTRPLSFPAPYKVYMGPSVGDLFFRSDEILRETLARYRGQLVAFHAEDPEILMRSRSLATHALRRPPEAEIRAIETAMAIAECFQIEPHVCHLSTAEGLEAIRRARRRGLAVTCEVAPHHLFYDQDNLSNYPAPAFLQVNPPIRSRLDRIALLEAFRADEIDYLATDHAPHTLEEKERGTSGMPHLDTYGAFVTWLRTEGVSWRTISRAASERPGRFLGRFLPDLRGRIEKGYLGSLTIIREVEHTVRRGDLRSRSGWSPFEGVRFPGRVSHTIVRGKIYPQLEEGPLEV